MGPSVFKTFLPLPDSASGAGTKRGCQGGENAVEYPK